MLDQKDLANWASILPDNKPEALNRNGISLCLLVSSVCLVIPVWVAASLPAGCVTGHETVARQY